MKVFAFLNVDRPWIAWLVYRGEMVSRGAFSEQVLSVWHATYLIGAARDAVVRRRFARELEIEALRKSQYSQCTSRLSGLYLFEDLATARRAGQVWGGSFHEDYLTEIDLDDSARVSRHDSEWITRCVDSLDTSWIVNYLSGQPTETPMWELLADGRGLILGTEVRKRAYETLKEVWPASLALLELSRVAVELGSDLGFIAPIITVAGGWVELRLCVNFRDAKNPEFLEKPGRYQGPKNIGDLNASSELVVPNLSEFAVRFQLPDVVTDAV